MAVKTPATSKYAGWPAPQELFRGNFVRDSYGDQSYDVAPDGRFLMMRPAANGPVYVQVVLDWLAEVRAAVAATK
jgi:hypothetical protein